MAKCALAFAGPSANPIASSAPTTSPTGFLSRNFDSRLTISNCSICLLLRSAPVTTALNWCPDRSFCPSRSLDRNIPRENTRACVIRSEDQQPIKIMRIQKLLQTLAIGSLLFSSVAVLAADESTKQTANRESSGPFVFDLSFPGGTVPDFVAHVEKALDRSTSLGAKPNLIVPSEAGSLKLPKLELRSVDMDTLMNAAS